MIFKETSLKDEKCFLIRDTKKTTVSDEQWMRYIENNNGKTCKIEILEK